MLLSVIGGALIGNGAANLFMHRGFGHTFNLVEIGVGFALFGLRMYQLLSAEC